MPEPPVMALRTYLALRLGMVAVIATLGVSLLKEIFTNDPNCAQGSISAYYFTPVQSVFVGTLVALGVGMIVLWGKTWVEDGFLNLAGLMAPVVAFVPTKPTNLCSLVDNLGNPVSETEHPRRTRVTLVEAAHDSIFNNMLSYFIVVGAVLLLLVAVGVYAQAAGNVPLVTADKRGYWIPLAIAAVVYAVGLFAFVAHREWFYDNAHKYSAILLFAFIVIVILAAAYDKFAHPVASPAAGSSGVWKWLYLVVGLVMVIGAAVIVAGGTWVWEDSGAGTHKTFLVESWMLGLLLVFWIAQTIDRRRQGAPEIG